jgi:hypothetical protein
MYNMPNWKSVLVTNGSDDDNNAFKEDFISITPFSSFTFDGTCVETVKHLMNSGAVLPDVLLINVDTNEQEVLECVAMLRSVDKFNSLPIILYSKSADTVLVNDAYAMGATFFWVNPHLPLKNKMPLQNLSANPFNAKDKTLKDYFVIGNTDNIHLAN